MERFTLTTNAFLSRPTKAFYHTDYVGYGKEGNPDYINTLKNIFNNEHFLTLEKACEELKKALATDFPVLKSQLRLSFPNELFTVCVVPRSKAYFMQSQLLFKQTVSKAVDDSQYFCNGVDYIERVTNTRTTHMKSTGTTFENSGDLPYPGIALDTCSFSKEIRDKNIILVDDIYTKTVNIDEDFIEALYCKGAKHVIFYAIGKTSYSSY